MQQVPDPADLFDRKDEEDAKWMKSRPVCEMCRRRIQEEPHIITVGGMDFEICEDCWYEHKEKMKEENNE